MPTVKFKLQPLLYQYQLSPKDVAEASGLPERTVRRLVGNRAKTISLEMLAKLLWGFEQLTGRMLAFDDLLELSLTSREMLKRLLRDAKPLDWEGMLAKLPPLTDEEKAEGEAFIRTLEEHREQDRRLSAERDRKLLELFVDEEENPD